MFFRNHTPQLQELINKKYKTPPKDGFFGVMEISPTDALTFDLYHGNSHIYRYTKAFTDSEKRRMESWTFDDPANRTRFAYMLETIKNRVHADKKIHTLQIDKKKYRAEEEFDTSETETGNAVQHMPSGIRFTLEEPGYGPQTGLFLDPAKLKRSKNELDGLYLKNMFEFSYSLCTAAHQRLKAPKPGEQYPINVIQYKTRNGKQLVKAFPMKRRSNSKMVSH